MNSFDVDYLFFLSGYALVVESAFIKAKKEESVVRIKNVEDICAALTDRETLGRLLEQELGEGLLDYRDEILEFFMSIKDTVRMEDLAYHKTHGDVKLYEINDYSNSIRT